MQVKILYFAVFADLMHCREAELILPEGSTVEDAFQEVFAQNPVALSLREQTVFAVEDEYVEADTVLKEGQEIVFLPPVSGG